MIKTIQFELEKGESLDSLFSCPRFISVSGGPAAAQVVSICLGQPALSIVWRSRFRQETTEMVLRAITYLEWKEQKR